MKPDFAKRKDLEVLRSATTESESPLSDIAWLRNNQHPDYALVPSELTGVASPILVLSGRGMATGSANAATAWSMIHEARNDGRLAGGEKLAIAAPTAFAIAAAWASLQFDHPCTLVLPHSSHPSVLDAAKSFNADIITLEGGMIELVQHADGIEGATALSPWVDRTPYHYHAGVTAPILLDLVTTLARDEHVGRGRVDAVLLDPGMPGSYGFASTLKETHADTAVAVVEAAPGALSTGVEPPAWTDRTDLIDHIIEIDDTITHQLLELIEKNPEALIEEAFVPMEHLDELLGRFSLATMRNVLAAVMLCRRLHFDHTNLVVTIAPEGFSHGAAALEEHWMEMGGMDLEEANRRTHILSSVQGDSIVSMNDAMKEDLHNVKKQAWVDGLGFQEEEWLRQRDPSEWTGPVA